MDDEFRSMARFSDLDDKVMSTILGEHRALAILRMLARFPAYTGNCLLLESCLGHVGLPTSQAVVKSTLNLLASHQLVALKATDDVTVVELLSTGLDAAKGLIQVAGILRPPPQCPY
jgi:hypothetical protein